MLPYTWTPADGYVFYEENDVGRIGLPVAKLTITMENGQLQWECKPESEDPLGWTFPKFATATAAQHFILAWYSELKIYRADQWDGVTDDFKFKLKIG